jgi:hypothetical protein
MKDIAEIVRVRMYSKTCYQVNLINIRTGMYYNSSSQRFDDLEKAVTYANENSLTIKIK